MARCSQCGCKECCGGTLEDEIAALKAQNADLLEALKVYVCQYACTCGHKRCLRCDMMRVGQAIIAKAEG